MTLKSLPPVPDHDAMMTLLRRAHDLARVADKTDEIAVRGLAGVVDADDLLRLLGDVERAQDYVREVTRAIAVAARSVGATWEDVGQATGLTRTGAHMRYSA